MGCTSSKIYKRNRRRLPYNTEQILLLQQILHLSYWEILRYYEFFNYIKDGKGIPDILTLEQLYRVIGFIPTKLSLLIFNIDNKTNNYWTINFHNFILYLWLFCSLDKSSLMQFIFNLYAHDGLLSIKSLREMIKNIYGQINTDFMAYNTRLLNRLEELDQNSVLLTDAEFENFVSKQPSMFYPVHHLQFSIRTQLFGVKYWERTTKTLSEVLEISECLLIPRAHIITTMQSYEIDNKSAISKNETDTEDSNSISSLSLDNEVKAG